MFVHSGTIVETLKDVRRSVVTVVINVIYFVF